ncbi:NADH dehydrogenase [ubiquinone] 1 alpha subcomplex subunit 10, mitochondrial-like [Ornithodoros turicata]|uniref:NADH dehydrogenase [ubiquinone] 1 alpha subcomplex subunit 10, mitochondrial-like n=1 Tax=Ornithodoros turicata TaxID=34597 RepID=UPI003138F79D
MAGSISRLTLCGAPFAKLPVGHAPKILAVTSVPTRVLTASMTSKQYREPTEKPKPFPYETKTFRWYHGIFEDTLSRFDENTKVIVVDGNIGAGKTTLVKTIAEEFDLRPYFEPSFDLIYVDDYGFDYRSIDHLVPESCRTCDIKKFYEDPHNLNVANMQILMYRMRVEQYLQALAHVLNTGQGVVLERSAFSDMVFANTMNRFGYMSKPALDTYHVLRNNTTPELLRPHLVIYLDVPSDISLKRIKQRNIPYEVNSEVLTKDYLDEIDRQYKFNYLKSIRDSSELLIYDWSSFGDTEVVVEDIERINFEKNLDDKHSPMFHDWKKPHEEAWTEYRYYVTTCKGQILGLFVLPASKVPELVVSGEDQLEYEWAVEKIQNRQIYQKGYNPQLGDSVLFKMGYNKWHFMDTNTVQLSRL